MKTETIIKNMLTENTGAHMLDSGGAYGRNYDRNKKRNFKKEPTATIEFDAEKDGDFSINVTKSLYHFLVEGLSYDAKMQAVFNKFVKARPKDDSWFELVEAFPKYLESMGHEVKLNGTENTYNYDNFLDQVIQYTDVEVDGAEYIVLQTHNGCDVRGGYSAPKIFKREEEFGWDSKRATVACSNNRDHVWDYDGDSWQFEGTWERGKIEGTLFDKDIESMPMPKAKRLSEYKAKELAITDKDTNGYCPLCLKEGKGQHRLKAY